MGQNQIISDAEMGIMRIIWKNGGQIRFGPLMAELEAQGRVWKSNTVLTFLTRLAEKGLLSVEKQGRLNIYHATVGEKEYLEGLTQTFLNKIYGGDARGLVAALLRQESLTKQDMEELQNYWEGAKMDE